MSGSVRDVDKGYRELMQRVFKMRVKVAVGIFETDGNVDAGDGVRLIEVATWNEFGTDDGHVPSRSFLRAWFDENQDRARAALRILVQNVVAKGEKPEKALEQFGLWLQAQIQVRIARGIAPANATSTTLKKGSSKPLIDKGQLRSSVTYAIDLGTGDLKVHKSDAERGREDSAKRKARDARKAGRKKATLRRRARKKAIRNLKRKAKSTVRKSAKKFLRKARRLGKKLTR